MAILAIALHGVLLGLAPLAAASAADPFSVICHSVPQSASADDQSQGKSDLAPATGCEHCNLCNAAAPPRALDDVLTGQLTPARLLQVLRPVSTAVGASLATTPKLARGPPAFA